MAAQVVIIGASVEGALLAGLLGRRGLEVELFEVEGDRSAGAASALLTVRSVVALRELGLAREVLEASQPVYGYRLHAVTGARRFEGFGPRPEAVYAIGRERLRAMLLEEACTHPTVRLHRGWRCVEVDALAPRVRMEREGERREWDADLLVAADGPDSPVIAALQAAGRLRREVRTRPVGAWRLEVPPRASGKGRLDDGAVHVWPRTDAIAVGLPRVDGGTDVVVWQREPSDPLRDAQAGVRFVQLRFPDLAPLVPELLVQWSAVGQGDSPILQACSVAEGGRCVLLGRAASSAFPWPGVGEAAGMHDAAWLDRLVGWFDGDMLRVQRMFVASRAGEEVATLEVAEAMLSGLKPGSVEAGVRWLGMVGARQVPRLFVTTESLVYLRTSSMGEVLQQERARRWRLLVGAGVLGLLWVAVVVWIVWTVIA